jgi:hypothetical protein
VRHAALALLLVGCNGIDTGDAARRDAAEALRCPSPQVETEQVGAYRYVGRGCGRVVTVACTASAFEPRCLEVAALTSGGMDDSRDIQERTPRDVEPPPETEAQIRAGLRARRQDVLACTSRDRVAVRVAYAPDGEVSLTLEGDLEGSPQQRCVQDVLSGVRVAATGTAGVVVHLVR